MVKPVRIRLCIALDAGVPDASVTGRFVGICGTARAGMTNGTEAVPNSGPLFGRADPVSFDPISQQAQQKTQLARP